jgi:glycosyltransferase involved in cell wall biosynthesis
MASNPLISIVIAVYNNEKYIKNAIKSVVEQDFDNYEIVIVDDGSTDNTPLIVDDIEKKNSRISVIHQENQWIYASFNNGIKKARGEYIYILNSDDILLSESLISISRLIEKYKHPDVIWTGISDYYCDNELNIHEIVNVREWDTNEAYYDINNNPEIMIQLFRNNYFRDQANVYKRDIMLKVPFRNDFYAADSYFNYGVASIINTCAVQRQSTYAHFRFDDKNKNVANKKYYGYEHYMYNELFIKAMEMLKLRNIYTEENRIIFASRRKGQIASEIKMLLEDESYKSVVERLDEVFMIPYDSTMEECFGGLKGKEEFEARILSQLEKYFLKMEIISPDIENHFAYRLLESLLRYEKTDEDYAVIKAAIYQEKNLYHIGETFYNKLLSRQNN